MTTEHKLDSAKLRSTKRDESVDWEALKLQSHSDLRRRTVEHIRNGTTDLSEGPMLIATTAYTDEARHEQERRVLFQQRPILAAFTGDVPNPGDTFLFDEVGPPILLVRNKQGELNAFLNMCTHRAAKLVTEGGKKNRMSCKFHGWTFDLDGNLVGRPGESGFCGIEKVDRKLIAAEWHGLIFVRAVPGGEPIDVVDHLGEGFAAELAHLQLEKARPMKTSRINVEANWKYAMDTYGEGYHFATLHPSSIGALAMSNIMSYTNHGPNHRLAMPRADFLDCVETPEAEWPPTSYGGLYYIFPNTVINCNTMANGEQFYGFSRLFPRDEVGSATSLLTTYKPGHMPEDADAALWTDMHDFIHRVVETEDYSVSREGQVNMKYAPADFQPVLGANELALQNIHQHIQALLDADR
jgi:phenylpropionate dioxygenase-like ring-hydroxylating dioxygenase large terminal subunit